MIAQHGSVEHMPGVWCCRAAGMWKPPGLGCIAWCQNHAGSLIQVRWTQLCTAGNKMAVQIFSTEENVSVLFWLFYSPSPEWTHTSSLMTASIPPFGLNVSQCKSRLICPTILYQKVLGHCNPNRKGTQTQQSSISSAVYSIYSPIKKANCVGNETFLHLLGTLCAQHQAAVHDTCSVLCRPVVLLTGAVTGFSYKKTTHLYCQTEKMLTWELPALWDKGKAMQVA